MKKYLRETAAFLLTLLLFYTISLYLGYMYMPERRDYGATWNMYGEEKENSIDVMFVGSSLAYCDIIPARIYEKIGITSYVVGAPSMTMGTAYYYLKEALKTQNPDLIMVEATSFYFSELNEKDSKINVGYMPYSLNRLAATFDIALPSERLGLLFPLYNYHSRWSEVGFDDLFRPRTDQVADILAGYTYIDTVNSQKSMEAREYIVNDKILKTNSEYLEQIIELCRTRNIKLELFMVPSCKYISEELTEKVRNIVGDIPVIRFNDNFEELGIDINSDYYDDLHLNFYGALKYSDILANHIASNHAIVSDDYDEELWEKRIEHINSMLITK